jgi:hypothetical protein
MVKKGLESQNSNVTEIQWIVHPIRRNWKVSAGVVSFLVILCAAIYFSFNSLAFLLLSVVILVSSLSPFFFPTKYTLRDDRIVVKSLIRRFSRQWNFFRSYYPDKNGVLLSPFSSPSRLENFRGVYIRFGHNRAEVVDFIGERIKDQSLSNSTSGPE